MSSTWTSFTSTAVTATSSTAAATSSTVDGTAGSAQQQYGQSLSTFVSSITASLIVFGVELWLFAVLRKRLRRVYEPKTYAVPRRQRVPPVGRGLIDWLFPTLFMPENEFIKKCGLDAYFFMRYLSMLIFIFFTASIVVLPVLLPVNSANTSSGSATGLDKLAWVNVGATDTQRYWAHLVLAVLFIIFLCAVFHHELSAYVRMRQDYLISPTHRLRASATTVLIRAVPEKLLDVQRIATVFSVFPGGVRNVWINRNMQPLQDKINLRNAAADKLEAAETELIQKCVKAYNKQQQKKAKTATSAPASDAEQNQSDFAEAETASMDRTTSIDSQVTSSQPLSSQSNEDAAWKKYIKPKDRPRHRVSKVSWLPALPLPGLSYKVDTIDWARDQLEQLNLEIADMQQDETVYKHMHSCFIQFNNQIAAHMACQSLASESAQYMAPRIVEINPNDIIWSNMRIKWWESQLRTTGIFLATCALVVGWAFPVAFVGIISQLSYLTSALPFLDFLNDLPAAIKGIIAGILPPAALAALMAVLPIILRVFALLRGNSTGVQSELTVQSSYFAFLFVQVFLVITISSSVTTVIQDLTSHPTSVPQLLAQNLPKAANFFFSYLILQGLTISAAALLRVGPLVMMKIVGPVLDKTARQKFHRITQLEPVRWGTFYPIYTNLGAIGVVYTIIAPLIMPMCLVAFTLFYIAYRYQFIYCTYNPIDSSGLYFPRAINHLFTGIYVMELCLIGLFFLVRNEMEEATCTAQAIIMIVVFFITFGYQYILNRSFGPLLTYLPVSLEGRARLAFKAWLQSHNQDEDDHQVASGATAPLLGSSPQKGYRSISSEQRAAGLPKADMKKRFDEEVASELELQTQGSSSSSDNDEEYLQIAGVDSKRFKASKEDGTYDADMGAPVIESPIAQMFRSFKKPITTLGTATPVGQVGQIVGNVGSHIGAHIGDAAGRLGLNNVTGLIYTGNDQAQVEAEILRNSADAMLLEGVAEDLEDISREEREYLVNRAFKHSSLRAKTPVIWIPHDDLGIAEDEIKATRDRFANVLISSDGAGLNEHGKVVFSQRPPDYDIKSKIAL